MVVCSLLDCDRLKIQRPSASIQDLIRAREACCWMQRKPHNIFSGRVCICSWTRNKRGNKRYQEPDDQSIHQLCECGGHAHLGMQILKKWSDPSKCAKWELEIIVFHGLPNVGRWGPSQGTRSLNQYEKAPRNIVQQQVERRTS